MKAAVVGENSVEIRDLPKPEPKANEVLVRVRACGLNRADLGASGHRHGSRGGVGTRLGLEWAGEVAEPSAPEVQRREGRRPGHGLGAGRLSPSIAATDAGPRLPHPANNMTFAQAATFPSRCHHAQRGRDRRPAEGAATAFLIQGASAGVGLMGMQIAKLRAPSW